MTDRVKQWITSRRGVSTLAVAVISTLLVSGVSAATLGTLMVVTPVSAAAVWLVANRWERRTWPATPAFARGTAVTSGSRRMLREDANARIIRDRGGFLFEVRFFFVATGLPPHRLGAAFALGLLSRDHELPVAVMSTEQRNWWYWQGAYYWENSGHQAKDVLALLAERKRRTDRELNRAHALLAAEQSGTRVPGREPITASIRQIVWERDGGRCVQCQNSFDLQYDHIIPLAWGGANTPENLQLLCASCNQKKGASLG